MSTKLKAFGIKRRNNQDKKELILEEKIKKQEKLSPLKKELLRLLPLYLDLFIY